MSDTRDVVERLRAAHRTPVGYDPKGWTAKTSKLVRDAADEIERLRLIKDPVLAQVNAASWKGLADKMRIRAEAAEKVVGVARAVEWGRMHMTDLKRELDDYDKAMKD